MKHVWKWILIGLGIALVVFLIALPMFGLRHFGGVYGLRGYTGHPMMGLGGVMMFGWGIMLLKGLFCLAVLGFAVYGVIALVRGKKAPAVPPPAPKTCKNCGRIVEKDWVNCPYCGNSLKNETQSEPDQPQQ